MVTVRVGKGGDRLFSYTEDLGPEGRSLITKLGHSQITGDHSSTGKQSIPFRTIVGEVEQSPKIQGLLYISIAFQITG